MNFIKLVNFETNRFFKFFVLIAAVVAVVQLIGLITMTYMFKHDFTETKLDAASYALQHGTFEFQFFTNSGVFTLPVLFAAFSLFLYAALIWYREWFGKSSFIYRLLMLPTSRMNVYAAKLTTILLFTFSLLAWQVLLVGIFRFIPSLLLEEPLYVLNAVELTYLIDIFAFLLPFTLTEFLLIYGFGVVIVVLLFTAILLERSYRLKGILFAIGYIIAALLILLIPIVFNELFYNMLYSGEKMLLTAFMGIIVIVISCFYSRYLLKYKITV